MPKEQYDFIKGIQDYMLEATNMEENEAWSFGFRIWQTRNWLRKYIAIEVSEDCISRAWVHNMLTKYVKDYELNELDSWQNTIVEWIATDIEDAPSVIPSRAEGEWIRTFDGN